MRTIARGPLYLSYPPAIMVPDYEPTDLLVIISNRSGSWCYRTEAIAGSVLEDVGRSADLRETLLLSEPVG